MNREQQMISVVFKNGPLTTHMRYHPKVFATVTKYMLKQGVDSYVGEGRSITLKGNRVYLEGQLTTWDALEKEFVK
jgi:hypothetical protein